MNKDKYRIILTSNEDPTYIDFWSSSTEHWKNHGFNNITIGLITDKNENDNLVKKIKNANIDVKLFKPISGIPTGNQAKATRMYLASELKGFNIIQDIEYYIFDIKKIEDVWSRVEYDKIIAYGKYNDGSGKFPMYNTCGDYMAFKKIVNPNDLKYEDLFKTWMNIRHYDDKEAINKGVAKRNDWINKFSDESLLRTLIRLRNFKNIDYVKEKNKRLDMKSLKMINKIYDNYFFDCFPPRPYNKDVMEIIMNYLEIPKNKRLIK